MKTLLALGLAGLFLASATAARAQTNAQSIQVAVSGIFSFTAPPGWTLQDNPGQPYKRLAAPATGAQSGSISIETNNDTTTPLGEGALAAVAQINTPTPGQTISNGLVMSSQPLATAAGPAGLRVVIDLTANNSSLVEVLYMFRYSKGTAIFAAAFSPSMQNQYAPLVDSAMSSIKLQ